MNRISIFDFLLWHNKRINFRKEQSQAKSKLIVYKTFEQKWSLEIRKAILRWKTVVLWLCITSSFYVEFTRIISPTGLIKGPNRWKASGIGQSPGYRLSARKRQVLHLLVDATKIGTAELEYSSTTAVFTWLWTFGLTLLSISTFSFSFYGKFVKPQFITQKDVLFWADGIMNLGCRVIECYCCLILCGLFKVETSLESFFFLICKWILH